MPVFELLHEGPPVILDVYHKHGEWWVEVKDREDGRRSVVAKRRVQPDGKIELLFAVNDLAHAARVITCTVQPASITAANLLARQASYSLDSRSPCSRCMRTRMISNMASCGS